MATLVDADPPHTKAREPRNKICNLYMKNLGIRGRDAFERANVTIGKITKLNILKLNCDLCVDAKISIKFSVVYREISRASITTTSVK